VVQLLSLLTLHKRYNIICPTVAETAGEQPARIQLKINEKTQLEIEAIGDGIPVTI